MAQNLNIGKIIFIRNGKIVDYSIKKMCYENDEKYCAKYGGLYSWDVMMEYTGMESDQGICPSG